MLNRIFNLATSPNTSLFFVGLMFFVPFIISMHYHPISAFYNEWVSAILGTLASLALLNKNFLLNFRIPQFSLVFIGLAVIVLMQALLGMLHSPKFTLLVLSYVAWSFVLVVLGGYLRRELGWERIVTVIACFAILGGIWNFIFVMLQAMIKSGIVISWMPLLKPYGAVAQSNNFADYIGIVLASLMYLYAKRKISLHYFSLGLLMTITLLAFSGSRASWLYLSALTVLAVGLQIKSIKMQNGSANIRSLLRVSLLLLPLFAILQFVLQNTLPDKLIELPNEQIMEAVNQGAGSARLQFWQTSWYMFTQNPWLGIGTGQMRWQTFLLLDNPALNPSKMAFEHAHNLFLHLFVEMGIGAGIFAIVGFFSWAKAFKWRELNLETWWLIALLAVMGIHSMLEYPLWYTFFLGIFAFLMGAGEEKSTEFKLPKVSLISTQAALFSFILIASLNLATMGIAYHKLSGWMTKAHDKTTANSKIIQTKFYEDFVWSRQYSLLSPYAEIIFLSTLPPKKEAVDDLLLMSLSAMRFSPAQNVVYRHALLLHMKGDKVGAAEQMNRALIAYPKGFYKMLSRDIKYQHLYIQIFVNARPTPPDVSGLEFEQLNK